jgi:hypothetical protein
MNLVFMVLGTGMLWGTIAAVADIPMVWSLIGAVGIGMIVSAIDGYVKGK